MENLKALTSAAHADMQNLSMNVHQVMEQAGYASPDAACRTECSVSIGADGKPVVTCRLICDM